MTTPFISYRPQLYDVEEMLRRARNFEAELDSRRSVRHFSDKDVPRELIEAAIRTASTAPSGAHRQPWKFVAVSDPELKKTIRSAVEEEEKASYTKRMPVEWKEAIRTSDLPFSEAVTTGIKQIICQLESKRVWRIDT